MKYELLNVTLIFVEYHYAIYITT